MNKINLFMIETLEAITALILDLLVMFEHTGIE